METLRRTINNWKGGVRFYIALAALVTTLEVWWWAHARYSGTVLFATRMEEVFAWLALSLITLAVFIGPFFKIFPRAPGKTQWFEARRLLGVSGGWFASLHVLIAYKSLFNFANPLLLPIIYQQAFSLGAVALVILLAMVATSFDRAFHKLGIWWFRLHRLVYVALLAILAHSFVIGVHATLKPVVIVLAVLATTLVVMHLIRQKRRPNALQLISYAMVIVSLVLIFNYGFTHSRTEDPEAAVFALSN
jgi:DMSO/TMAO reductase YedYZ heme-binding membrane subunit